MSNSFLKHTVIFTCILQIVKNIQPILRSVTKLQLSFYYPLSFHPDKFQDV
jgi:hypothetical protein